jgi:hypothetical protein
MSEERPMDSAAQSSSHERAVLRQDNGELDETSSESFPARCPAADALAAYEPTCPTFAAGWYAVARASSARDRPCPPMATSAR